LVFIKKGGEIRLCETLATRPSADGKRCQHLIPGKPGDDKNKTQKNEFDSSDPQQFYHAAHAYVHAPARILIWKHPLFFSCRIKAITGLPYLLS
jgi:hypothetical protein